MLKLYNTLTKKEEVFEPIEPGRVRMYSCGPTVYNFAHIGNLRSCVFADIVKRTLQYEGLEVKHVMNITDVGHLVSDLDDSGEDKMTKALKREGLPLNMEAMKGLAIKYEKVFLEDIKKLNCIPAQDYPRASDHIAEDIEIIKKLEEKGFTYKTSEGLYFDTSKDALYGMLGGLSKESKERIEENTEKKNQKDFALWKFSDPDGSAPSGGNPLGWESPWGKGFPGWHIECSAMSMKYLGEHFDIHTGGIDHIPIHHNNEIAQSENATDKKFVNVWLHHNFVNINNEKIAKSLNNEYYLKDIESRGYSPLDYRYFLLSGNYRSLINFTWDGLEAAQKALKKLKNIFLDCGEDVGAVAAYYKSAFTKALEDNLNTSEALAVLWQLARDEQILLADKKATLLDFDKVLGLGIDTWTRDEIPAEVMELVKKRALAKAEKNWPEADEIRNKISELGYEILDKGDDFEVRKI